jgi:hypothetical protein
MSSVQDIARDRQAARQVRALAWATEVYGDRVKSARYQAFRFIEEAMELAQTQGLTLADLVRTAEYVSARKVGDTKVEIGDVVFTLDILAENLGISVDGCHTTCLNRIKGLDPERCREKDAAKIAEGLI